MIDSHCALIAAGIGDKTHQQTTSFHETTLKSQTGKSSLTRSKLTHCLVIKVRGGQGQKSSSQFYFIKKKRKQQQVVQFNIFVVILADIMYLFVVVVCLFVVVQNLFVVILWISAGIVFFLWSSAKDPPPHIPLCMFLRKRKENSESLTLRHKDLTACVLRRFIAVGQKGTLYFQDYYQSWRHVFTNDLSDICCNYLGFM